MTDHTTAERAKFEAAYRDKFETAAALQPGIFEIDEFGDYLLAKVFVAFEMWKIGRATLPMACPITPDALLISQVFEQFRKDACLTGDDRISESFIKAAGALMGAPLAIFNPHCINCGRPIDPRCACERGLVAAEALLSAAQSEPATRAVRVAYMHRWPGTAWELSFADDDGKLAIGHSHAIPLVAAIGECMHWVDAPCPNAAPTPDAERHVANHAGDFSPLTEERKSQIAESVARRYGDACRTAIELAFAAPIASALPAQPVALTVEQREAIEEVICLARDEGLPGTADMLRSILAAPAQPTDKEPT